MTENNITETFGIVSDHGGYELKNQIIQSIRLHHPIIDLGVHNTDSVDYPILVIEACHRLLSGEFNRLIALCGTGIGASIAANRLKGIRAALCHDEFTSEMSRKHNNSNVLVMGGRVLSIEKALLVLSKWIDTGFEGGRHERRIRMLDELI